MASLVVLDEAEPAEPGVDVEDSGQFSDASNPFHSHYYEDSEEAEGLRGGLPGPMVWKDWRARVSARFKSTFWKRISRVSCSSCLGMGFHLLWLDGSHRRRETPTVLINVILVVNRI